MELLWLPRARKQQHDAIEYIALDNPIAALGQTDMLLQQPKLGRPGRMKGTRELVIGRTPFIVVYRVRPRAARIEVLHLLHGSQQWPPKGAR